MTSTFLLFTSIKNDKTLNMPRLWKQIKRLDTPNAIPPLLRQNLCVPRLCGGVTTHIHHPLGSVLAQLLQKLLGTTFTGRINDDRRSRSREQVHDVISKYGLGRRRHEFAIGNTVQRRVRRRFFHGTFVNFDPHHFFESCGAGYAEQTAATIAIDQMRHCRRRSSPLSIPATGGANHVLHHNRQNMRIILKKIPRQKPKRQTPDIRRHVRIMIRHHTLIRLP
mmetsp:Transcript_8699/g.10714  ORF Transcript_8699/g.10714 Transcript_8699/m.10714 type:complete len:222 (-) Transcript_8699:1113-1778(-)